MKAKLVVASCLALGVLLNLLQLEYTYTIERNPVNWLSPIGLKATALHVLYGLGIGTGFFLLFFTYHRRLDRAKEEKERAEQEKRNVLERANIELRTAQGRLVQAEKLSAIGQLAAGIAHELNNPLQAIAAYTHLLQQREPAGTESARHIGAIQQAVQRCERIVRGLLAFSRRPGSEKTTLSAREVVERSLLLAMPDMKARNIQVAVTGDDARVHGDPIALQQVLTNLLLNARDAIGSGGSITIGVQRANGSAEISVLDTGPGIPREVLSHLFEPFFTTKPPGQGTGLGLSVAYGIVQEHGGKIEVESGVGRGATFRVRLPAAGD